MRPSKYQRIRDFVVRHNLPSYRAGQILNAIFRQRIGDFAAMTSLPAPLRAELANEFGASILEISPVAESSAAQTEKLLFQVGKNQRVESVHMRYRAGWQSLCISTQSGCGIGCRFCATGAIGLQRNLSADEITDQLLYFLLAGHSIDSLSLMGMGEPLANPETLTAISLLTDKSLFNMSPRRITVSTVGMIPGLVQLSERFPQVNLVFSLHSPFDEERSELIPLNRRYPLAEILPVLDWHVQRTHRQVSIAYLLLQGINDSLEHADALVGLFRGRRQWERLYHFNILRYHPAQGAPDSFAAPEDEQVRRFVSRIRSAGLKVTQRPTFGREIEAACGQLHGRYQSRRDESRRG